MLEVMRECSEEETEQLEMSVWGGVSVGLEGVDPLSGVSSKAATAFCGWLDAGIFLANNSATYLRTQCMVFLECVLGRLPTNCIGYTEQTN